MQQCPFHRGHQGNVLNVWNCYNDEECLYIAQAMVCGCYIELTACMYLIIDDDKGAG